MFPQYSSRSADNSGYVNIQDELTSRERHESRELFSTRVPPAGFLQLTSQSHRPEIRLEDRPAIAETIDESQWLCIRSETFDITQEDKEVERRRRGSLHPAQLPGSVHDILSASLEPLTYNTDNLDEIKKQATAFFSAFSDGSTYQWEVDVRNVFNFHVANSLYGQTVNSSSPDIAFRFVRFRFPFVRFEWHVETPYYVLNELSAGKVCGPVKVQWKAWAKYGAASGLVGYGFISDRMTLTEEKHLVIKERTFTITKLFQPELMMPVPYMAHRPIEPQRENDVLTFSTSQTVIQFLRSIKQTISFLVAISALFSSIKPLVDRVNPTAGYVLIGMGIVAATISILSRLLGLLLRSLEIRAAKVRAMKDWDMA